MAYVYVCDSCLDGNHPSCEGTQNTPNQDSYGGFVCGGGHCICTCHVDHSYNKFKWIAAVQAYSIESREKRERGTDG